MSYVTARERCMRVTRVCVFNMLRECDTCIRRFDGGSICTHINIKDFREEKMRACMRLYVCTEDGGAGRKRGGDSVCEKRKKTQI